MSLLDVKSNRSALHWIQLCGRLAGREWSADRYRTGPLTSSLQSRWPDQVIYISFDS